MLRSTETFLLYVLLACWAFLQSFSQSTQSHHSGHALLFHNDIVVKEDFKEFPTTQLTFEAWISSSDYCHTGTILSYALNSQSSDQVQRIKDFNHFVIFDQKNLIACHDYQYIDLFPDFSRQSCHSAYNSSVTTDLVSRDSKWHHLAVTWDGLKNGNTKIYSDGMLVAEAMKTYTRPLQPNGALMLGAEQDCYGGCTDPHQGYYGMMDEVRIWKTIRTQSQIMQNMRISGDFDDDNLVAYWKFDDPDTDSQDSLSYQIAKDSSKYGNNLFLKTVPSSSAVEITKNGESLQTHALSFHNNYAMQPNFEDMPQRDFTIEFWAKTGELDTKPYSAQEAPQYSEFLSFATVSVGDDIVGNDNGLADAAFIDDAIRIERYLTEFQDSRYLENAKVSTRGAISIRVNANRQGNGKKFDNWLDFSTNWVDGDWHHIAVTWSFYTGTTTLFFDGKQIKPFWASQEGVVTDRDPSQGGVSPVIGKGVTRSSKGSLVLGQNQECFSGCFSPSLSYDGQMAVLRIWDRVLSESEIKSNMMMEQPSKTLGLKSMYNFQLNSVGMGSGIVKDLNGAQDLLLGGDGPSFRYSDAPLTDQQGRVMEMSSTAIGYALRLHDEQVLMLTNFQGFPGSAVTVEFWMQSVDSCRMGVPFSYAAGNYQNLDNAFLIFNYNDWGVSVMEDEGTGKDHTSGIAATDGKWHYVAVTWTSQTGMVRLYQDGRLAWVVQRGKGKVIPSGGTLVIGREQDCEGGCFDSAEGAAGQTEDGSDIQYGAQDFFGILDEMRLWSVELTPEQIYTNYQHDLSVYSDQTPSTKQLSVSQNQDGLVAYWTFDEGSGYSVRDRTGNNHDLAILEPPEWVVVSYNTSRGGSVCGNSIVEHTEQCDDGNLRDGDGCDSSCNIEPGYRCLGQTSICTRLEKSSFTDAYKLQNIQQSKDIQSRLNSNSNNSNDLKNNGAVIGLSIAVVFLVVVIVFGSVLYVKREWVYDHFPAVERGVRGLQDKMGGLGNKKLEYHQYDVVAWDPEQTGLTKNLGTSSENFLSPYAKLPDEEMTTKVDNVSQK